MYTKKSSFLKHIDFYLVDTITLIVSFMIAYFIRSSRGDFVSSNLYTNILLWMIVPNLIYYILFNPYKDVLKRPDFSEIKLSIIQTTINFLFVAAMLFILQSGNLYSRLILGYTYVFYFVFSIITRLVWKRLIKNGTINVNRELDTNLLIISNKNDIDDVLYNIRSSDFNRHIIKGIYLTDDNETEIKNDIPVVIKASDIHEYVVDKNINIVFIAAGLNKKEKNIIKELINEGIEVQLFIDSIFDVEAENREVSNVGMYNTLQLNSYDFTRSQRIYFVFKRFLDIVFSLLACLFLIPIYLFIKISYLLSGDKESILYSHKRIGLDGKTFDLYKFRSMIPNADDVLKELLKDKEIKKQWDKNQKLDDDPRITKIGRFIRKTSLDEFPQFINVLKGDMSIIGPRPLVPGELKSKNGIKLYERVKPGITGWWACNGRSDMSYEERLEHEYYYVKNCSLYLDVVCVLRTIFVVIFEKGAK